MAHKLALHSSGEYAMAYVGDRRSIWHGLGQQIPEGAPWQDVLRVAHLDYDVETWPILALGPEGDGVTYPVRTGHVATVRTDTNTVLGVVGHGYQVMNNADAFAWLDGFEGIEFETAGAFGRGEVVWILARDPRQDIKVRGEEIRSYLLLWNSHNGTMKIGGGFTKTRVVCWNTFVASLHRGVESRFGITHTANAKDRLDEAARVMGLERKYTSAFQEAAERLALRPLTPKQALDYFYGLMPEPDKESKAAYSVWEDKIDGLMHLYRHGLGNRGESAWDAVNAAHEFSDHFRRYHKSGKRGPEEARMYSGLFGSGADFKQRSWDLAQELFALT